MALRLPLFGYAVDSVTQTSAHAVFDQIAVLPQALKLTSQDMSEADHATRSSVPIIVEPDTDADADADIEADAEADADADAEERGRLKRRRESSHSPPRAASPSRGHDRDSGSRHRHHHRNHHRDSESASMTPPPAAQKKQRRRSDAEPDHTFRGRARNRSGSRERTGSPIFEDDDDAASEVANASEAEVRELRKRAQPPSRPRDTKEEDGELRRQKSYPNLYRKNSRGELGKDRLDNKRPHPLRQQLSG